MSFLRFADDAAMYDSTPLDNMFIIENLPSAPETFLKVYIYARMLCMHPEMGGMDELARALRVDNETIANAFQYWERFGFVRRVSDNPPEYVFMPARGGSVSEMDRDYYKYRDFNNELQSLFPAGKLMHPAQYALANDWLNVLGFSQDAVIELIKGVIATSRSKNPDPIRVFKTADKRAAQLANAGITDLAGIQREFARDEQADSLAREVLHQFGLRRAPTEPELKLAAKWLYKMNILPEDVLVACDATVKAHNPSFAYLDSILANRRGSDGIYEKVQQVFHTMGLHRAPADEQCRWYEGLISEGFEHDTIELAARVQSRRTMPSLGGLESMLSKWRERGLYKYSVASSFVEKGQALKEEYEALLRAAGIERNPTEDDLVAYEGWKQALPAEVIQMAAEASAGRTNPIGYLFNLIDRFKKAGVTTPEAAGALLSGPQQSAQPRPAAQPRQNPALDYIQRDNSNQKFDGSAFMAEVRRMRQQEQGGGEN